MNNQLNGINPFAWMLALGILALFQGNPVVAQHKISHSEKPKWVDSIVPNGLRPDAKKISDGYYYKLLDYQLHAEQRVSYTHVIREIVNESGLQYGVDVSVSFSPTYQQLTFHELFVIRGGHRTRVLDINKFRVVAIEQDAASFIYNGDYSAYLVLDDIRVGDQIEYSYSITGRNPVFEDRYFQDIYLQSSAPIAQLYTSVLVSSSRQLHVKVFNGAPNPVIVDSGQLSHYSWSRDLVEAVVYESYTPSWFDAFQHVQLSEYSNWEEVGAWALGVNPYPDRIDAALAAKADEFLRESGNDLKEFAHAAIRFVQDEIRYTGVEIGEYSHRAHRPNQVFAQRYGDCKDKSLLLVSLLRHAGLEAYMALVNTHLIGEIAQQLPSPLVFNHAIVQFTIDEKPYWVDPTISHQGGDLDNRSMPIYGKGLVLASPASEIKHVASNRSGMIKCEERYQLDPDERGTANLEVKTIYRGHEADDVRLQLSYGSVWDTEKNYLDYYSKLYPSIASTDSLEVHDDRARNEVTLVERYRIPEFLSDDGQGQHRVDLFAQLIYDRFPSLPGTKNTPVAVGYPSDVEYRIAIVSPYGWNIRRDNFFIDRDNYVFGASAFAKRDTLILDYQFRYHTPTIPVSKRAEFAADIKKIVDQHLSKAITVNMDGNVGGNGTSWYAVSWAVVLICLIAYIGRLLYRHPFPPKTDPESHFVYDGIGGWLVLPLLAFFITPINVAVALLTTGYFDSAIWNAYQGTAYDLPFRFFMTFELTGNIILGGVSVICAVFMTKRKVLLPGLAIGFFLFNFIFLLIDFLSLLMIQQDGSLYSTALWGLVRAFVFAVVWVPYFFLSKRVKETFVNP